MGKWENGPDMHDVSSMLRRLELDWSVECSILVESDGSPGGSGLRVHLLSVPKSPRLVGGGQSVAVTLWWPHFNHKRWEGVLMQLILTSDFELSQLAAGRS